MTKRRLQSLLHVLEWAALVTAGCSAPANVANEGGQTGSASCGTSPRCICDAVADANVVRGVLSLTGDAQATVRVSEVFGNGDVALDATLAGPYQSGFPCGVGNSTPPMHGAEVLAVVPRANSATPSNMSPSNMYIVEWASSLQLTSALTLPATDAAILADPAACALRFPDEEVVCEDTL